jgi:citrate synthase
MGIFENLHEAQRKATGAAGAAIGSLLSLPHATLYGVVEAVQGKSFNDASTAVMNKYAEIGQSIGRDRSDEIVKALIEAHTKKKV